MAIWPNLAKWPNTQPYTVVTWAKRPIWPNTGIYGYGLPVYVPICHIPIYAPIYPPTVCTHHAPCSCTLYRHRAAATGGTARQAVGRGRPKTPKYGLPGRQYGLPAIPAGSAYLPVRPARKYHVPGMDIGNLVHGFLRPSGFSLRRRGLWPGPPGAWFGSVNGHISMARVPLIRLGCGQLLTVLAITDLAIMALLVWPCKYGQMHLEQKYAVLAALDNNTALCRLKQ